MKFIHLLLGNLISQNIQAMVHMKYIHVILSNLIGQNLQAMVYIIILILHFSVCLSVRAGGHGKPFDRSKKHSFSSSLDLDDT